MRFRTPIHINSKEFPSLNHSHELMSLGSCFSEHIGNKLKEGKFTCCVNPYGVLYNPASIAKALYEIAGGVQYKCDDLFYFGEQWHSWMHHGSFSSVEANDSVKIINKSLIEAHTKLKKIDYLFLTFGSAWIYKLKETGEVVSNCHKKPEREFCRERLTVDSIVATYKELIDSLLQINPHLQLVFSVSPIRHIRDGLPENQISKSILLLAINELVQIYPTKVYYFPAYEIVLDELRDYRFYADDMVHPSKVAVEYIWDRFSTTFFDQSTSKLLEECNKIKRGLDHRPSDSKSNSYVTFLEDLIGKMEQISINNPKLDFTKEIELCRIRLKR